MPSQEKTGPARDGLPLSFAMEWFAADSGLGARIDGELTVYSW